MRYEIGPRIRKYREAQNLSQKELAKLIGVSNSRISNWEQGINRPDDMNEHERKVIMAYRTKLNLRQAVDILLGIDNDGVN